MKLENVTIQMAGAVRTSALPPGYVPVPIRTEGLIPVHRLVPGVVANAEERADAAAREGERRKRSARFSAEPAEQGQPTRGDFAKQAAAIRAAGERETARIELTTRVTQFLDHRRAKEHGIVENATRRRLLADIQAARCLTDDEKRQLRGELGEP